MKELTQAQAVSQARKVAKENGLVLRKANVLLAGTPAYRFYDRQTGAKKSNLMTLRCIKEFANNSPEPWTSLFN